MPRRRTDDEYDDEEDVRPRRPARRKKRRPEPKGSPLVLILILVGVGVLVLGGGGVAVWLAFGRDTGPGPVAGPATPPGLVAHWSFDEDRGARAEDRSGRGNHGTLVNARLANGVRGRGLALAGGMNEYCEVGAGPALNFPAGSGFTILGWFSTLEPSGTIVSFRHTTLPTQLEVLVREGRLEGIIGDDIDASRQGCVWGLPANDGRWHHFALVRAGGTADLFLDGNQQEAWRGAQAPGPITTDVRAIGCERLWVIKNDMRWGRPGFVGGIDEVMVFARALDPSEIRGLMGR